MVSHTPARREDDKVGNGHARSGRFGRQHSKDGWILLKKKKMAAKRNSRGSAGHDFAEENGNTNETHCMVEGHTVDDHEVVEVVLVWCVVAVPGHHVEGGEILTEHNKT